MFEISVGKPCTLIEQADSWKEIGQSSKKYENTGKEGGEEKEK